jgi:ABC-type multidrug transport system fused ATPase/permease subunit
MEFIKKIKKYLHFIEKLIFLRSSLSWIIVISLISPVLEILVLGLLGPFVQSLLFESANPVKSNLIYFVYSFSSLNKSLDFYLFSCIFLLMLISLSQLFKLIGDYLIIKFVNENEKEIGLAVLRRFLSQDYLWHLNNGSSSLSRTLLTEIGHISNGFVRNVIIILTNIVYTIILGIGIVFMIPSFAVIVLFFIFIVMILYFITSKKLQIFSLKADIAHKQRYSVLSKIIISIKQYFIFGRSNIFLLEFEKACSEWSSAYSSSQMIGRLPRHFIELLIFSSIVIFVYYTHEYNINVLEIAPIFVVGIYGVMRFMQPLLSIYSTSSEIRFVQPYLLNVINFLDLDETFEVLPSISNDIYFTDSIIFNNISFTYGDSNSLVLKEISFIIRRGDFVGLVGPSGSGKSTLVDILSGLLSPSSGIFSVDGLRIDKDNITAWRNKISYVSQDIVILNDTMAANIAFGVELDQVDLIKLNKVISVAQLNDLVNYLPNGLDSVISELGSNLSGGQKQRIGIARALYFSTSILIIDEATSGLDRLTEDRLIKDLLSTFSELTIVWISHKSDTMSFCNNIIQL